MLRTATPAAPASCLSALNSVEARAVSAALPARYSSGAGLAPLDALCFGLVPCFVLLTDDPRL